MFLNMNKNKIFIIIYFILIFLCIINISCFSKGTEHKIIIMNTTDEHQYLLPYNYIEDNIDETIGLSKIYTLVKEKRNKHKNTLLLSAGDIIQGSLIGELEALIDPVQGDDFQTIVKVFNHMKYDAVSIGNHDITDFGLDFFERARKNSNFPWVSANIKIFQNPTQFYVEPYIVLERKIDDKPIKIGIIGFVPPQIKLWGRHQLEGKLIAEDIISQANKYIPLLKEKTDIVIALAHTGIGHDVKSDEEFVENAGYQLAKIDGIDALILGHRHEWFPGNFDNIPGIDNENGLIHGVPTTLAASWGRALGVIELNLIHKNGNWTVKNGKSYLKQVSSEVASNKEIEKIANEIHNKTINYVRTPIGKTNIDIASYFSRILDSPLTQLINNAQLWYGKYIIEGTEYENIPLLSAAAAFIAGREGPGYFTNVTGEINIGDVTDMYIYPNTIKIVKLNGLQLIEYLEHAAHNFNMVNPLETDEQHLINYDYRAFNFDVVEGIEYIYDITKPVGSRVIEATYKNQPITPAMEFLIIMNNYRASGGGDYPYMTGDNVVIASTDVNREAIISYIRKNKIINPVPTKNWKIKSFDSAGKILYRSSPAGEKYINRNNVSGIKYLSTNEDGWGIYELNLLELY